MGKDFLRKKTQQFVRCRNREYARLVEKHLFSGIPARESTEVTGAACSGALLEPGAFVVPHVAEDGSVTFYSGRDECVRVSSDRAGDLTDLVHKGTSVGQIVDIDDEFGSVRVRLLSIKDDSGD